MDDTESSFDDLLCRSLILFRQFRLYDELIEEENAYKLLRIAEQIVTGNKNGVCVAKLGCVVECLAHKYYIDDDTDKILEEVDTFLTKFWKGIKNSSPESFISLLWVGEYFLLRFRNPNSRVRSSSKKMVSKTLELMADMLRKPEKKKELCLTSNAVFEETLDWIKQICDTNICEKQVITLLQRAYYFQEKGLLHEDGVSRSILRQHIWDFYY